jgi:hypothetical protein
LAGAVLGDRHALAGQRGLRGGDRVQGVVLALGAAHRGVRAGDFEHRDAGDGEVARQAGAEAAGLLDANPDELTVAAHPREHRSIAGAGCRERAGAEDLAMCVDDRSVVQVQVRVDATDDRSRGACDAVQRSASPSCCRDGPAHAPSPPADTTVKGRLWSGSHQVTLGGHGREP